MGISRNLTAVALEEGDFRMLWVFEGHLVPESYAGAPCIFRARQPLAGREPNGCGGAGGGGGMARGCGAIRCNVLKGSILVQDDENEEYCCYPKPEAANLNDSNPHVEMLVVYLGLSS